MVGCMTGLTPVVLAILEAIPHYQPAVPEQFAAVFRALGLPI